MQKGQHTKREILRKAKALFMEKGFSAVTMTDLCEASGLSRGGLYRYFTSTKDVFYALLEEDKNDWETELQQAMGAGVPAADMLAFYLNEVYKAIADGEGRLSLAIYEYARSGENSDGFLARRYDSAVEMMEWLLRYGQSRGEFLIDDVRATAEHGVIFMDGMKMAAAGLALPLETVRRQLDTWSNTIIRRT